MSENKGFLLKLATQAGAIISIVTAFTVIAPFIEKSMHAIPVIHSFLGAPLEIKRVEAHFDSLFHKVYVPQITNEIINLKMEHDSAIFIFLNKPAALDISVGLRAKSDGSLFYRDRYGEMYRVFPDDSTHEYWYLNKYGIKHWAYKKH